MSRRDFQEDLHTNDHSWFINFVGYLGITSADQASKAMLLGIEGLPPKKLNFQDLLFPVLSWDCLSNPACIDTIELLVKAVK